MEKEIPKLEAEKSELSDKLSGGISDFDEISRISTRLEEVVVELEMKELRWLELSEWM